MHKLVCNGFLLLAAEKIQEKQKLELPLDLLVTEIPFGIDLTVIEHKAERIL